MPDHADYLARILTSRLKAMPRETEGTPGEGQAALATHQEAARREVVVKVLAVHAGITDEMTIQKVLTALPFVRADGSIPDRDAKELADYLRANLSTELR